MKDTQDIPCVIAGARHYQKGAVDNKALPESEKELEFEAGDNKEYEVKTIIESAVYGQQANNDQMAGFYYLVL